MIAVCIALGRAGRVGLRRLPARAGAARAAASAPAAAGAAASSRCRSSSPPTTRSRSSQTRSPTSGAPTTHATLLELIVASDGSEDGTVEAARRAGATPVLDLPRIGKLAALNRAAQASSGEILVFTDADSLFEPGTLRGLVSNFADEHGRRRRGERGPLRRGGRPAGRARRGPLLALRAPAQAPRGPGRQRGLGQRPPLRGTPQLLHALDADRGHRRLPDLEPGRQGRALGSRSTSARSCSWPRPRRAAPSCAARSA